MFFVFFSFPFCSFVRRRIMQRMAWQSLDVPTGWVQVLKATSAVGEVASSARRCFSCTPVRKGAPAENASVTTASRSTTVAPAKPSTGVSCRRRHSGSSEVGECHCSIGREEPTCEGSGRSSEGCKSSVEGATGSAADPIVQDFRRTCQEARSTSPGSDCKGTRAESDLREGGCRRRDATPAIVGGRFVTSSTFSTFSSDGVTEADRRVGSGTRFVESHSSQGTIRSVVCGRTSTRSGHPTHANESPRVGRLDQRAQLRPEVHWNSGTQPQL